jgi:intracellular sulfur oxidation DsrE/DsrF family protein
MKKFLLILPSLLLFSALSAQSNYKVVFDITSKDTVDHKNVIRWINTILQADANANLEVVFYGQSLDMVVKNKSILSEKITSLASNKNVVFDVCAIAMKAHDIDKSQLLPGVQIVPDGIYEIISKQRDNWGYIKVSH